MLVNCFGGGGGRGGADGVCVKGEAWRGHAKGYTGER